MYINSMNSENRVNRFIDEAIRDSVNLKEELNLPSPYEVKACNLSIEEQQMFAALQISEIGLEDISCNERLISALVKALKDTNPESKEDLAETLIACSTKYHERALEEQLKRRVPIVEEEDNGQLGRYSFMDRDTGEYEYRKGV